MENEAGTMTYIEEVEKNFKNMEKSNEIIEI